MAGFLIFNVALTFAPMALMKAPTIPKQGTDVQLIVGSGTPDMGGNIPHIAVFTDDGKRIGQYTPGKNEKIDIGQASDALTIADSQIDGKQADPYYILLSQMGNDAICIAAITVSNPVVQTTFFGNTGRLCGQSWFPSKKRIGTQLQKPNCVWLDRDHTNGINAAAMSFHISDMINTTSKMDEYHKNIKTLCQSTPRFSFWGNLLPDSEIPIFPFPHQYRTDSGGGEGGDMYPLSVIDGPAEYDKSVYMYTAPAHPKHTMSPPINRLPPIDQPGGHLPPLPPVQSPHHCSGGGAHHPGNGAPHHGQPQGDGHHPCANHHPNDHRPHDHNPNGHRPQDHNRNGHHPQDHSRNGHRPQDHNRNGHRPQDHNPNRPQVHNPDGHRNQDQQREHQLRPEEHSNLPHNAETPPPRNARRNTSARGSNHNPEHLIITNWLQDDVREVCEDPNSYGWDIVSTVQNLYCDMEAKQLYNLCDGRDLVTNCFDLTQKTIIPNGGDSGQSDLAFGPLKAYTSVDYWEEE